MAGGIAHDFNNILSAILGYGDMALTAAPESGPLKRYMNHLMAGAHRARALVDQILTYSQSTRGKRSALNVSALVEETLDLVRASLPTAIALHSRISEQKASAIGDPIQIHQLLMNLCTNAIHAMKSGGALSVSLDAVDVPADRELSHGLLPAGHHLRLAVHDTGCGMDAGVTAQIFQPFFTTRESGRGTGLGLALVHGIVTEMGGAIDVTSELGAGSLFEIYLPGSDAAAIELATREVPLQRGQGQRILVVEDEVPLMLLAEEMLAALGYEPAGFTRPDEALIEFRADPSRFDALILDQLMPGMTGIELARRMREARPDIPVLLVSGYMGPLLHDEALAAGVDQLLTKPLDLRRLSDAIAQALSQPDLNQPTMSEIR
jgi:CheY-like chemotaxis protein